MDKKTKLAQLPHELPEDVVAKILPHFQARFCTRDGVGNKLRTVRHLTYLLNDQLESGFAHGREREIDGTSHTFTFQRDGIDATLWVSASVLLELDEVINDIELFAMLLGENI